MHQDASYADESSWDKLQVTAWVPLVDATVENGCMQVLDSGHRTGRVATHTCCVGGTWYTSISDEEVRRTLEVDSVADLVTCEVPRGSVLLLNSLLPHRSLPNTSEGIRWSLDLRWQRAGEPNGFHGIKPNVPMRRGGDKNFPISWDGWAEVDRAELQMQADAEFDTRIAGPWMHTWEVTNANRHTEAAGNAITSS